jgi:rhodanese-related sulfurtransferase
VARENDPRRLPASIEVESLDTIESFQMEMRGRTVVTFCTCPNEASAALLADRLLKLGHSRVRVLTGGTDALSFLSPQG